MGMLARVSGGWGADPLWGVVYDFMVEHPVVGRPAWALGLQSDLRRLYAVCDEISELPAGSRVLDLPCGGGVALRGLRSGQQVTYVAADIAPEMLARTMDAARARGVDHLVSLTRADAGALGFDDASYDLVVSLTGLHCFPDPEAAVAEMGRVLRPGPPAAHNSVPGRRRPQAAMGVPALQVWCASVGRCSNISPTTSASSCVATWLRRASTTRPSASSDGEGRWCASVRASTSWGLDGRRPTRGSATSCSRTECGAATTTGLPSRMSALPWSMVPRLTTSIYVRRT